LLISEVLGWDSEVDIRGVWTNGSAGASVFTCKQEPNDKQTNDKIVACDTTIPPVESELKCTEHRSDGDTWAAARSEHPGGVVCSLADGSVRFVSEGVNIDIWREYATRAGAEVPRTLD
jgi:hypothetical protein